MDTGFANQILASVLRVILLGGRMVAREDVKADSWQISLTKLTGLKIKDIIGYIAKAPGYGELFFQPTWVVLEDGREIGIDGEHEFAYLTPIAHQNVPNLDDDTLADLYRQARIEDGDDLEDEEE